MLIFRKRSISVKASSADIIETIKKLPLKRTFFNSYSDDSFSFGMWDKSIYGHMRGGVCFLGTIEEQGEESIIKYSLRPNALGLLILLVFSLPFFYSIVLFLFTDVSMLFFALSILFPVIIVLSIIGQEQTCDDRFTRKLHELEDKVAQIGEKSKS